MPFPKELAKDVYEEDSTGDAIDDDDDAVEHVRDQPNYLNNLGVEEYAEGKNHENKIKLSLTLKEN